MFPEVSVNETAIGYGRQMVVYVVHGIIRAHEGRLETMYPRASLGNEQEVDDVQLVFIASSLGEVTVISRLINELFFLLGIRSMMIDLVIVKKKSKENFMKLFVWPLIQMHSVFRATELDAKPQIWRVSGGVSAREGNLNIFATMLLEVANGDLTTA